MHDAPIAQSVERGPYESKVESSSLPGSNCFPPRRFALLSAKWENLFQSDGRQQETGFARCSWHEFSAWPDHVIPERAGAQCYCAKVHWILLLSCTKTSDDRKSSANFDEGLSQSEADELWLESEVVQDFTFAEYCQVLVRSVHHLSLVRKVG